MTPPRTVQSSGAASSFLRRGPEAFGLPVCRLGLASHAGSELTPADIHHAVDRGVNFLNWAGDEDVFSRTIAGLGARRRDVVVCVQFAARSGAEAATELAAILAALHSDYVDILTLYYVESAEEWQTLIAPDGALPYCREVQRAGR